MSGADRIVVLFPVQWYSTPALMKKYEDDVLTYGWAYGSQGKSLQGKEFLVVASTGSPANAYSREGIGYTITELLRPLQQTARFTGVKFLAPYITFGTLGMADEDLTAHAEKVVAYGKNAELPELAQFA